MLGRLRCRLGRHRGPDDGPPVALGRVLYRRAVCARCGRPFWEKR